MLPVVMVIIFYFFPLSNSASYISFRFAAVPFILLSLIFNLFLMKGSINLRRALPLFAVASLLLLAGCGSSSAPATPATAAKPVYTAPDNSFRINADGTFAVSHDDSDDSDTYTWEQDGSMVAVIEVVFTPEELTEFTPQKILDNTVDEVTAILKPESIVKTPMTFRGQPAVRVKGTVAGASGKDQYFDVLSLFANNRSWRVGINSLDPIPDAEAQAVYDSFSPLP